MTSPLETVQDLRARHEREWTALYARDSYSSEDEYALTATQGAELLACAQGWQERAAKAEAALALAQTERAALVEGEAYRRAVDICDARFKHWWNYPGHARGMEAEYLRNEILALIPGPAAQAVEELERDAARWKWAEPILSGDDTKLADSRAKLLAAALLLNKPAGQAIDHYIAAVKDQS